MDSALHISGWTFAKQGSYVAAFLASLEWLGFVPETLFIFGVLMILDFATGIARARKVDGKEAITSESIREGVLRKALTLTAVFSVGLTGKGIGFDMSGLVQASTTVLILAECYSILGNVHSYRTGQPKKEYDGVSTLISFILSRLKKALSAIVK